MTVLNIDGKNYTLYFGFEASLYDKCTKRVMQFMSDMFRARENESVRDMVSSMSDVPQTAFSMFHAGLLANHGTLENGKELEEKHSKELLKLFLQEHSEDEKGNFYYILNVLIECMENDKFFGLIGIDKMLAEKTTGEQAGASKKPGRKKTTKKECKKQEE